MDDQRRGRKIMTTRKMKGIRGDFIKTRNHQAAFTPSLARNSRLAKPLVLQFTRKIVSGDDDVVEISLPFSLLLYPPRAFPPTHAVYFLMVSLLLEIMLKCYYFYVYFAMCIFLCMFRYVFV